MRGEGWEGGVDESGVVWRGGVGRGGEGGEGIGMGAGGRLQNHAMCFFLLKTTLCVGRLPPITCCRPLVEWWLVFPADTTLCIGRLPHQPLVGWWLSFPADTTLCIGRLPPTTCGVVAVFSC